MRRTLTTNWSQSTCCRTVSRQRSRAGKTVVRTTDGVLEGLVNDVDKRRTVEHDCSQVERLQGERRCRRLVWDVPCRSKVKVVVRRQQQWPVVVGFVKRAIFVAHAEICTFNTIQLLDLSKIKNLARLNMYAHPCKMDEVHAGCVACCPLVSHVACALRPLLKLKRWDR